jgi:hypothetical protein
VKREVISWFMSKRERAGMELTGVPGLEGNLQ